jgi:3-hydroxyacyl-CoA dehydrogenase/enoyl-CoA hydratase/3-hydroxybutyryl-CoA epimerase
MSSFKVDIESGTAVITLDVAGAPVNTLSTGVAQEFDGLLTRLESDPMVGSIVLISGKAENFIAGADIEEFTRLRTAEEATALSRQAQELMNRVEACRKPVVAAIHGSCLGGGMELALACHWRVATDHPKTQLGLPEVQLGIIPGAGGCNRLPRLIGMRAALDIILPGKSERAAKARKLGLIDELVHPAILRDVALRAALRLAQDGLPVRSRKRGAAGWLLDGTAPGRALVYRMARKQLHSKTGGNYPAPVAALDTVRLSLSSGMEAGLAYEALRFGELAVTDVSRNLVGIFFATTASRRTTVCRRAGGDASHGGAHRRGRGRVHGRGNRGNGGAQRGSRSTDARRRPAPRRQGDQDGDRHPRRAPQAEATHPSRAPAAHRARIGIGR